MYFRCQLISIVHSEPHVCRSTLVARASQCFQPEISTFKGNFLAMKLLFWARLWLSKLLVWPFRRWCLSKTFQKVMLIKDRFADFAGLVILYDPQINGNQWTENHRILSICILLWIYFINGIHRKRSKKVLFLSQKFDASEMRQRNNIFLCARR